MTGGGSGRLVCVVTGNRNFVAGGIPVFVHDDEQERQRLALYIAKITQGMVHDLEGGNIRRRAPLRSSTAATGAPTLRR